MKRPDMLPPKNVVDAMIAMETRASMSAYSIEVAPESPRKKGFMSTTSSGVRVLTVAYPGLILSGRVKPTVGVPS